MAKAPVTTCHIPDPIDKDIYKAFGETPFSRWLDKEREDLMFPKNDLQFWRILEMAFDAGVEAECENYWPDDR